MPTLFSLHLSRHVRGMVKGPVRAIPAAYAGVLGQPGEDGPLKPDPDSVRACLPVGYRKAWDRAGGTFWYSDRGTPYLHLHDTRGRYFNTLYAIPYVFSPGKPAD